jgi:ElaB/YqjD/DUF883 family membrane-anchored ribosome-binding protein
MAEGTAMHSSTAADTSDSSILKETVVDLTEKMRGKASEVSQKMSETIDEQRAAAASTLRNAATTLYTSAESLPGEKIKHIAQGAAEKIDQTSEYIRRHDASAVVNDVTQAIRRYPGRAIVVSLAVGFLLGRLLTSD